MGTPADVSARRWMMDEEIAGRLPGPSADRRVGHAVRALVADGFVLIGLLAAVGGDGFAFFAAEFWSHRVDWGLIVALAVFGLLLAAFGECLWLDPTPAAHAEATATTAAVPDDYWRRGSER